MKKIVRQDYQSWKEYYHAYQFELARQYYIPYLNGHINIKDKQVLEIGCGNGGFIEAFAEHSSICVGFDIKEVDRPDSNAIFHKMDAFDVDLPKKIGGKFDVIILRDVIEHLDNKKMDALFSNVNSMLSASGRVLVTFPPFFSAFGLHQQALMGSYFKYVPFLSLIPKPIMKFLIRGGNQKKENREETLELYNSRQTISSFLRLVKSQSYKIVDKKFFYVRPSHEIRYGLKTIESKLVSKIPVLREVLISGTVFLIEKDF